MCAKFFVSWRESNPGQDRVGPFALRSWPEFLKTDPPFNLRFKLETNISPCDLACHSGAFGQIYENRLSCQNIFRACPEKVLSCLSTETRTDESCLPSATVSAEFGAGLIGISLNSRQTVVCALVNVLNKRPRNLPSPWSVILINEKTVHTRQWVFVSAQQIQCMSCAPVSRLTSW